MPRIAVEIRSIDQMVAGESHDALNRLVATAGDSDEALVFDPGVERLLAFNAEHDRQVKAHGGQSGHQHMNAAGFEPDQFALMG